jgi:putative SOS response-associated peptidase YedK
LYSSAEQVAEEFDLADTPIIVPHYNAAPTQTLPVVRATTDGRELALLKWGLVPSWAEGKKMPAPINAMAETAATKPYFRGAFKKRRCLVPADGYYEWLKLDAKHKQPFFYGAKDGKPLALAGLWEGETFTILTTEANELAARVHNRMPVIVPHVVYGVWLDPAYQDVHDLLRPYPADLLFARKVSTYVSNAKHQGPECIEEA